MLCTSVAAPLSTSPILIGAANYGVGWGKTITNWVLYMDLGIYCTRVECWWAIVAGVCWTIMIGMHCPPLPCTPCRVNQSASPFFVPYFGWIPSRSHVAYSPCSA